MNLLKILINFEIVNLIIFSKTFYNELPNTRNISKTTAIVILECKTKY